MEKYSEILYFGNDHIKRNICTMVFAGVIYCGDPVFLSYQISSEMDEDRDIDRDTCFWNLGVLFYQTLDHFSGSINI